jgi:predicted phosphodiesterase
MRVAALYDIHGNLPALEATLADVRAANVDTIVVGGDVLPGPMPRECLDLLFGSDIPIRCLSGNGEREVLADLAGEEMTTVPEVFRPMMRWNGQQLTAAQERVVRAWPSVLCAEVDGVGDTLFCHATPKNDVDIFNQSSPSDAKLREMLGPVTARLVICGHTHRQFERMLDDIRIANAGSVGMAMEGRGARWLLLGPGVEFRCTYYDVNAAAGRIRATQYPRADEFVDGVWMT